MSDCPEFNNLVIDSGTNFQVLDIAEAGELQSIVIVSDNPYLQVFVQIDDFRNAEPNGMTVAELLYNGNLTQLSQRRFRAVDGQSPTVGYSMARTAEPAQYGAHPHHSVQQHPSQYERVW